MAPIISEASALADQPLVATIYWSHRQDKAETRLFQRILAVSAPVAPSSDEEHANLDTNSQMLRDVVRDFINHRIESATPPRRPRFEWMDDALRNSDLADVFTLQETELRYPVARHLDAFEAGEMLSQAVVDDWLEAEKAGHVGT